MDRKGFSSYRRHPLAEVGLQGRLPLGTTENSPSGRCSPLGQGRTQQSLLVTPLCPGPVRPFCFSEILSNFSEFPFVVLLLLLLHFGCPALECSEVISGWVLRSDHWLCPGYHG